MKRTGKKITGYHAAAMLVAFFAVVVGVNMLMARFALSSFGGTVVDNSYVASQKYNEWLEQDRQQQAHGWNVTQVQRMGDKAALNITGKDGIAIRGADIRIIAEHPVGRTDSIEMRFSETGSGRYESMGSLPEGRWKLKITVKQGEKIMRLIQEIR